MVLPSLLPSSPSLLPSFSHSLFFSPFFPLSLSFSFCLSLFYLPPSLCLRKTFSQPPGCTPPGGSAAVGSGAAVGPVISLRLPW